MVSIVVSIMVHICFRVNNTNTLAILINHRPRNNDDDTPLMSVYLHHSIIIEPWGNNIAHDRENFQCWVVYTVILWGVRSYKQSTGVMIVVIG